MIRRPIRLRPGDTVALVSPAGPVDSDRIESSVALLQSWGLRVWVGRFASGRSGFFSGTDNERSADLIEALHSRSVKAIFATRGGYGTQRIVDSLDLAEVEPKLLIGFSDVTALHLALWKALGWSSVYGSAWDKNDVGANAEFLRCLVMGELDRATLISEQLNDGNGKRTICIGSGRVSGRLVGGNLSLITSSIGTQGQLSCGGRLLFLEEVNEAPYRIDRMLTQLIRSGSLDGVAGIAVGQLVRCGRDDAEVSSSDVIVDRLQTLGVPVLGGIPVGHGANAFALPLGTLATLDVERMTLELDESPVQ